MELLVSRFSIIWQFGSLGYSKVSFQMSKSALRSAVKANTGLVLKGQCIRESSLITFFLNLEERPGQTYLQAFKRGKVWRGVFPFLVRKQRM